MKVLYTTRNNRMTVELEADTQADLFKQLARFQEVFEDTTCRKFSQESDNVRFVVRQDKEENEYYELRCVDDTPGSKLRGVKKAFGQHKKGGGLFPKVKDGDNYLPDNGWVKWDPKQEKEV